MMAQLLGREYTAIKDIKMTCATCRPCDFLILVPVQCIIEKQINSERIDAAGIFESSRTTSVAFGIIPGHVEEEYKFLKLPIARGKEAGGNTYFVIWTSKMKEQCSGSLCHFGRGFLGDKSLCFVICGGTFHASQLSKLIYSFRVTGEPPDGSSADQPHGFLLGRLFASSHSTVWAVPQSAAAVNVMVFAELLACRLRCMRFLCPITCLEQGLVLKEDSHNLQKLLGREDGEMWSSLPVLLLWMIKDRLDFFDNLEVALVCHHWRYASINYPTKMQTVGDGIPWIMQRAKTGINKCVCEFINIERRKKFAIELPEFYKSSLLFSKQGWILMRRNRIEVVSSERYGFVDSLFLINPLTKVKIDLPDVVINNVNGCGYAYKACFSTCQEGVPNCVVLYRNDLSCKGKIFLNIIYPGCDEDEDQVWTEHSCILKMDDFVLESLVVMNGYVYCCGYHGEMIIYNMGGQTTKEVAGVPYYGQSRSSMELQLMEVEGDVGLFGYNDSTRDHRFYKYSETHNSWQQLASEDDDANKLSMFEASGEHNLIWVRRKKGVNICRIMFDSCKSRDRIIRLLIEGGRGNDEVRADEITDVVIEDLLERRSEYADLPYPVFNGRAAWVDIG